MSASIYVRKEHEQQRGPCVAMRAAELWAMLRRMHEQFGVPLEQLQPLAHCRADFFHARVKKEGWRKRNAAAELLARLTKLLEHHMIALKRAPPDPCDEKRMRALATLAKALETIAMVEQKMMLVQTSNEQGRAAMETMQGATKRSNDTDATANKQSGAAALEGEISALVEEMS
ncbi:MAG: hypothetical protein OXR62_14235 [Ahrensia sp.]|nr:hypothetical protein [Ahrensia sp.]